MHTVATEYQPAFNLWRQCSFDCSQGNRGECGDRENGWKCE